MSFFETIFKSIFRRKSTKILFIYLTIIFSMILICTSTYISLRNISTDVKSQFTPVTVAHHKVKPGFEPDSFIPFSQLEALLSSEYVKNHSAIWVYDSGIGDYSTSFSHIGFSPYDAVFGDKFTIPYEQDGSVRIRGVEDFTGICNYAVGNYRITKGRDFTNEEYNNGTKAVILHNNYALKKGFHIGDTAVIWLKNDHSAQYSRYELQIIGFYDCDSEKVPLNIVGSFSDESALVPHRLYEEMMHASSDHSRMKAQVVFFTLKDPSYPTLFISEALKCGFNTTSNNLFTNDNHYNRLISQLNYMTAVTSVIAVICYSLGIGIGILILSAELKRRQKEIGIKKSTGFKNIRLFSEISCEYFLIALSSLLLSILLSFAFFLFFNISPTELISTNTQAVENIGQFWLVDMPVTFVPPAHFMLLIPISTVVFFTFFILCLILIAFHMKKSPIKLLYRNSD